MEIDENEFNVLDRITFDKIEKQNLIQNKYSVDYFKLIIEIIFQNLIENDIKILDIRNKDFILESVNKINHPEYKNAIGYILGYHCLYENKETKTIEIDKNKIQNIKKELSKINKIHFPYNIRVGQIQIADIIRYGELWISIL